MSNNNSTHPYSRSARLPPTAGPSSRRRSSSLPFHHTAYNHHSHSPYPPPSIPLPEPPPSEDEADDDWFPAAASPRLQPVVDDPNGYFLYAAPRQSSDTTASSSSDPTLAYNNNNNSGSRPESRASFSSGRQTPSAAAATATSIMRRLSSASKLSGSGGERGPPTGTIRSRSKSRARAPSDAESSTTSSTAASASLSVSPSPPASHSRRPKDAPPPTPTPQQQPTTPARTPHTSRRRLLGQWLGTSPAPAPSSPPPPAPVPALHPAPSLPHLPAHDRSDDWGSVPHQHQHQHHPPLQSLRRKTSAPPAVGAIDPTPPPPVPAPAVQGPIQRKPSVPGLMMSGLGGAHAVGTIVSPVVTVSEGARSRSNSHARANSGRDTPSLYKLLPDPPAPLAPSPNDGTPDRPYHIVVLGPKGCGKTEFITLGLEGWPHVRRVSEVQSTSGNLLYQVRATKITHQDPPRAPTDVHYRVLEIDSALLELAGEPVWPEWMPYVDGAFVLYDTSDARPPGHVYLAAVFLTEMHLPLIIIATKADLPERVRQTLVEQRIRRYGVGLVGVSTARDVSVSARVKGRRAAVKHCWRYMGKVVTGEQRDGRLHSTATPVSSAPVTPVMQQLPSRPPTPIPESTTTTAAPVSASTSASSSAVSTHSETEIDTEREQENEYDPDRTYSPTPTPTILARDTQSTPTPLRPPTPAHSHSPHTSISDTPRASAPQNARRRSQSVTTQQSVPLAPTSLPASLSTGDLLALGRDTLFLPEQVGQVVEDEKGEEGTEVESAQSEAMSYSYMSLEALCDRVFFFAVANTELVFLYRFFLVYRKFTTAKFVLGEWKKFWDSLDDEKVTPTMRMWGKLQLAHLISDWVTNFPQDFAAEAPHQAIRETQKVIAAEKSTMHYATPLKALIKKIDRYDDPDREWSVRAVDSDEDSYYEEDQRTVRTTSSGPRRAAPSTHTTVTATSRSSTLPLSQSFASELGTLSGRKGGVRKKASSSTSLDRKAGLDDKALVKDLTRSAIQIEKMTPAVIARELTRLEIPLFLDIEPREWPRHMWLPSKHKPYPDPIDSMAVHFMRVQTWVTSLILSREGSTARSLLIAKFCYVGHELRRLSNYNSLRAVHVGVKDALPNAPDVLGLYLTDKRVLNMFLYHDQLFSSSRNHLMYHRTLEHTPFFAIPCFEIHTSLLRRNERNPDYHPADQGLVHWGKFAIFGKIIDAVQKFQTRQPPALPEDKQTTALFYRLYVEQPLMNANLMEKRRAPEHFIDKIDKSPLDRAKAFFAPPRLPDSSSSLTTVTGPGPGPASEAYISGPYGFLSS